MLQKSIVAIAGAMHEVMQLAHRDLVMHLATEHHVDRSTADPSVLNRSNVMVTYDLFQAVRDRLERLTGERIKKLYSHHISADEVFGSLGADG